MGHRPNIYLPLTDFTHQLLNLLLLVAGCGPVAPLLLREEALDPVKLHLDVPRIAEGTLQTGDKRVGIQSITGWVNRLKLLITKLMAAVKM